MIGAVFGKGQNQRTIIPKVFILLFHNSIAVIPDFRSAVVIGEHRFIGGQSHLDRIGNAVIAFPFLPIQVFLYGGYLRCNLVDINPCLHINFTALAVGGIGGKVQTLTKAFRIDHRNSLRCCGNCNQRFPLVVNHIRIILCGQTLFQQCDLIASPLHRQFIHRFVTVHKRRDIGADRFRCRLGIINHRLIGFIIKVTERRCPCQFEFGRVSVNTADRRA